MLVGMFYNAVHWKVRILFVAHILLCFGLYNFHSDTGWSSYGARYQFITIGSVIVLVLGCIEQFRRLKFMGKKVRTIFLAVVFVFIAQHTYGRATARVAEFSHRFDIYEYLNRQVAEYCPEESIVEFLKPKTTKLPPFVEWAGFVKNYLLDKGQLVVLEGRVSPGLLKFYPEKSH